MEVSCDPRSGQLKVEGRALGVSQAWFRKGNFTAGSYVCECDQSLSKVILISECKDTSVCAKLSSESASLIVCGIGPPVCVCVCACVCVCVCVRACVCVCVHACVCV